jgi:hypothetical protein
LIDLFVLGIEVFFKGVFMDYHFFVFNFNLCSVHTIHGLIYGFHHRPIALIISIIGEKILHFHLTPIFASAMTVFESFSIVC